MDLLGWIAVSFLGPNPGVAVDAPETVVAALVRVPDPSWGVPLLESMGVRFRRGPDDRPRHVGTVHPIDAPAGVLAMLAASGWRVDTGGPDVGAPTDVIGIESGTSAVEAHGPLPLVGPTGAGVTVLSIDLAIDPFHPHLFDADGGAFEWIDVDADGDLDPDVDGIDADGDGAIADDERLVLLDHADATLDIPADGILDPTVDYLYVDLDGNGRRDFGAGFDESTPGYGEPMYLPDDADGDGAIAASERLLLLSTSRIAAFRHDGQVWRRGVDLVDMPAFANDIDYHGTGTVGILAGGQDHVFRRHRGLASGVDIVMASRLTLASWADYVEAYAWGEEEGADIVLHEYSSYSGHELDGSTLSELAIDESSAAGTTHVCPAGNLAAAQRHVQTTAMPASFGWQVPVAGGQLDWFELTLHWRDPAIELACVLESPQGDELAITGSGVEPLGGHTVTLDRFDSDGGTALLDVFVEGPVGDQPAYGSWSLQCTHDSPRALEVHAYLRDPVSFWNWFTYFDLPTPDPATTTCWPATANGCLTLGAYEFRMPDTVAVGDLAAWSSRGPRIDGGRTIDITAPRDPYAPYTVSDDVIQYVILGGTSSAAPIVTAAVAQLLEAEPGLTGLEVRERLRATAAVDGFVDVDAFPDDGWGYGKLRAHEAIFDEPAPAPPEIVERTLEVELVAGEDGCTALVRVLDVDWSGASFRWDDDYDGAWDSAFAAEPERAIAIAPGTSRHSVRVELGHDGWRVGGAAITTEIPDACFRGGPDGSTSGSTDADSTSASGPDGSTSAPDTTGDETSGPEESDTNDVESTSSVGADDDAPSGCGCATSGAATWWALAVLGWRRRAPRRR